MEESQPITESQSTVVDARTYTNWSKSDTLEFLNIMFEAKNKGWRDSSGSMNKHTVETKILKRLNETTGKKYEYKHYINKMKGLKKLWTKYENMAKGTFGFGYCSETKMLIADDEVWESYLKAHPKDAVLRGEPLWEYELLRAVIGGVVSTGEHMSLVSAGGSDYAKSSPMLKKRRGEASSHDLDGVEVAVEEDTGEGCIPLGLDDTEPPFDMDTLNAEFTSSDLPFVPTNVAEDTTSSHANVSHKKRKGSESTAASLASVNENVAEAITSGMADLGVAVEVIKTMLCTVSETKVKEREEKARDREEKRKERAEKAKEREEKAKEKELRNRDGWDELIAITDLDTQVRFQIWEELRKDKAMTRSFVKMTPNMRKEWIDYKFLSKIPYYPMPAGTYGDE